MEFVRITPKSLGHVDFVTISQQGIHFSKGLYEEIAEKGFKYAELYYACTEDGFLLVIKFSKEPTPYSYKISYRRTYVHITCKRVGDLLRTTNRLRSYKHEWVGDNQLYVYFKIEFAK